MSEISILVRKYFQRFHRNGERVEVGQEEVRVVDKDLVVQILQIIQPEEDGARQETLVCILYFIYLASLYNIVIFGGYSKKYT